VKGEIYRAKTWLDGRVATTLEEARAVGTLNVFEKMRLPCTRSEEILAVLEDKNTEVCCVE
jgi:hypothetical protein